MAEEQPRISVVVPTRDRSELLQRCLAALEKQTVPVEIVVVEDKEGRGPAWARNEGVRRAQGEVICFTDDDCAPFPGWAKVLTAPLFSEASQVSTGPVLMAQGATVADRAWAAIIAYLQRQAMAPGTASPGFVVTANLAVRRQLLERLPFDESFPAAAGEDRDWGERLTVAGVTARFVPSANVVHRSGMRVRDFLRQQYRYGRGAALYRRAGGDRGFGSPSFYKGLIQIGFAAGAMVGVLVGVAQIGVLLGSLAGD
jgi:glycosyltransferase involved in cell wall biosynthesis